MADSLNRDEPVQVCVAALDCLAETSSWTNMDTLTELMRHRRSARDKLFVGKTYYEAWGALADVGMTERRSDGGRDEERITEKGKTYLERYRKLLDKGAPT
jgi:hypothetical protein